jgi:hydrogenase expression/formation protein HypC
MSTPAAAVCSTCADEAVRARVVDVDDADAVVDVAGRRERVAIELVPDAAPGDLLLCHAGIALSRLEVGER